MLPEGWRSVVVGEVTAADRGYSYKSSDYGEDGLSFVTLKAIDESGRIRTDRLKSLTEAASATPMATATTLTCGDVLLAMTDLTPDRRIIGMPIVVGEAEAGMVFSMDLLRLKVDNEHLVDKFLGYCLARNEPRTKLRSMATGTTVGHLSTKAALSIEVSVPILSEQHRIVAVLERADRAVEAAARHAADAEALLKATIENEIRAGDVTPLGSFLTPAKEVVEELSWERELPISVAMGGRGISAAPRWKAERSKTPQQRVYAGDFVVLRQGAAGGGYAVIPEDFDKAVLSTNFMRFTIADSVDMSWWRHRITSPSLAAACERAGMGSAQNFLTSRKLLAIEIPVPPLAEQQAIVARIEKVEAAVRAAEAHLERLRALRSSLLENLVSGRVRLPMADATASEAAA